MYARFHKGDRVLVRRDLMNGQYYNGCLCVFPMKKFAGKVVTIKCSVICGPYQQQRYKIVEDLDGFSFSNDMLQQIQKSNFVNLYQYV